jgi:hypothetical protein
MAFLASEDFIDYISGIIHKGTQQHDQHLDLTVAEVHRITGVGSLDFGGSEFKPASIEKMTPIKQKPDDDYGWWKLGQGTYKIIFNETVDELPGKGIISPHDHTRQSGLISDTFLISTNENHDTLSMNVTVSEAGCHIKENARIASLHVLKK